MLVVKAGCPAGRVEQHRYAFQEEPWHNPETHGPQASEQVGDADLPHHAPEQSNASEEKHRNDELGDAHATVETFGGSLDDDTHRHTLCRCANSASIRWRPTLKHP